MAVITPEYELNIRRQGISNCVWWSTAKNSQKQYFVNGSFKHYFSAKEKSFYIL